MTERLRKILRGGKLTPMTADEKAVKIAVDNAGGGGDEYETVAEIAVGQMVEQGGGYVYTIPNEDQPQLPRGSESLCFNSVEYPLRWVETGTRYVYNMDDEGSQVGIPAYGVVMDGTNAIMVMSDSNAIQNTTVTILKKISGSGSITVDDKLQADSTNPVENGAIYEEFEDVYAKIQRAKPLIVHGTVDIVNSTAEITDEISLGEIYDAAEAGRFVAFECSLGEGNATRMELTSRTLVGGEYSFVFNAAADMNNKPAVVIVTFENSKTGTFEMAVAQ